MHQTLKLIKNKKIKTKQTNKQTNNKKKNKINFEANLKYGILN